MRPFFEGGVGNPNAQHSLGLEARSTLDGARAKVARLFAATPGGVIFTASATEANNLAVKGLAQRAAGRHIVTSAIEHISLIDSCRDLEKRGWSVTYVGVDADGRIDPEAVANAIRDETALVSVMAANNEIGTIQPVREIGRIARARGVPFHVDAVGRRRTRPAPRRRLPHRPAHALVERSLRPPGAGALWARASVKLAPLTVGGGRSAAIAPAPRTAGDRRDGRRGRPGAGRGRERSGAARRAA
jgi:cysteine desulfurase